MPTLTVMARRASTATARSADQGRSRGSRIDGKTVERAMGRPTALTDRTLETILGHLMDGLPITTTCHLAGIDAATFHRWMQRGEDARETLDTTGSLPPKEERFRDFRESVLDARAQAERKAVNIVFRSMDGGFVTSEEPILSLDGQPVFDENGKAMYRRTYSSPDGRLAMQYLQRARAKDWSQQAANINAKVEVSGPGGGPVEVEHSVQQVADLTQRLLAVREQFEEEENSPLGLTDGHNDDEDVVDGEVIG